jgi:hypothetical protein
MGKWISGFAALYHEGWGAGFKECGDETMSDSKGIRDYLDVSGLQATGRGVSKHPRLR